VAVASAGPHASVHLAADNHASTPPLSFLQAGCPSCCPTNSVRALKEKCNQSVNFYFSRTDAKIATSLQVQWNDRWHRPRSRIQTIRFASECKSGFTVNLKLDSVRVNTALVYVCCGAEVLCERRLIVSALQVC